MCQVSVRTPLLVSSKWLVERLSSKKLSDFRLLDGSWFLPNTGRIGREEFDAEHIPGAQFFDINICCDKSSPSGHGLPSATDFEEYVGALGICNNSHVVVYDRDDNVGILCAQRIWWTLKLFGHSRVSILDGGFAKWKRENHPVTNVVEQVQSKQFNANYNESLVKNFEEMVKNIDQKNFTVVDARPTGRFQGISPEPRPGIDSGHMPNSVNIPYFSFLDDSTRTMKSPDDIKEIFKKNGVDLESETPITATCGSGISACMIALGASLCGRDNVAIYDGSWVEWFTRAKKEHIISADKQ